MESHSSPSSSELNFNPFINQVVEYIKDVNLRCPGLLIPLMLLEGEEKVTTREYSYLFEDRIFCKKFAINKTDLTQDQDNVTIVKFESQFDELTNTISESSKDFVDRLVKNSELNASEGAIRLRQSSLFLNLLKKMAAHPYWQTLMRDMQQNLSQELHAKFITNLLISVAYGLIAFQAGENYKKLNQFKEKHLAQSQDLIRDCKEIIKTNKKRLSQPITKKEKSKCEKLVKVNEKKVSKLEKKLSKPKEIADQLFNEARRNTGFNTIFTKLKADESFLAVLANRVSQLIDTELAPIVSNAPHLSRAESQADSSQNLHQFSITRTFSQLGESAGNRKSTENAQPTRLTRELKSDAYLGLHPRLFRSESKRRVFSFDKKTLAIANETTGSRTSESQEEAVSNMRRSRSSSNSE